MNYVMEFYLKTLIKEEIANMMSLGSILVAPNFSK